MRFECKDEGKVVEVTIETMSQFHNLSIEEIRERATTIGNKSITLDGYTYEISGIVDVNRILKTIETNHEPKKVDGRGKKSINDIYKLGKKVNRNHMQTKRQFYIDGKYEFRITIANILKMTTRNLDKIMREHDEVEIKGHVITTQVQGAKEFVLNSGGEPRIIDIQNRVVNKELLISFKKIFIVENKEISIKDLAKKLRLTVSKLNLLTRWTESVTIDGIDISITRIDSHGPGSIKTFTIIKDGISQTGKTGAEASIIMGTDMSNLYRLAKKDSYSTTGWRVLNESNN
jgi:hypothetical protein